MKTEYKKELVRYIVPCVICWLLFLTTLTCCFFTEIKLFIINLVLFALGAYWTNLTIKKLFKIKQKERKIDMVTNYTSLKTYWITPQDKSQGQGTQTDPVPWKNFQSFVHQVGGGNQFIFLPGTYDGQQITLRARHAGTPQNPTVFKSEIKYKAIFHGSPGHAFYAQNDCEWTIFDGLVCRGANLAGIKANADNSVIRNCWLLHNYLGIEAHSSNKSVFERNLIEFNGNHPGYEHGIYADGDGLTIRQNIVRFNSSYGILLWDNAKNCLIENNLCYANVLSGILVCTQDEGHNRIIHNTIVENGYAFSLYFPNNIKQEMTIANNIIVNNVKCLHDLKNNFFNIHSKTVDINDLTIKGNVFWPACPGVDKTNIIDNPKFVDPKKGLFYLNASNKIRGKALPEYVSQVDFFGRVRDPNNSDPGCFMYSPILKDLQKRKGWHYGWPYYFKEEVGDLPELWDIF